MWDAARINLPSGKHALAESAYPVESAGKDALGRAMEYVKAASEYFSKQSYPYPYPVAINEAGSAGRMEYPNITFDSKKAKGSDRHALIAHEIGQTWFPMIVGTDERRNAWMDEGFDTFIDVYEADHFNYGEYAPTHGNPADEIVEVLNDPDAPPLLTRADQIEEKFRHPVTYFKSAFGLVLLREQIIGPERFDPAFRAYIRTWAHKHPDPADFFRFIESETGEDLSWFWRGWYEQNWKLDLAVQNVTAVGGDWSKRALVTVANLDKLVMPATLEVLYADGSKQDIRVPVETWMRHRRYAVRIAGDKPVKSAVIDPVHLLPDVDRRNNSFTVAR